MPVFKIQLQVFKRDLTQNEKTQPAALCCTVFFLKGRGRGATVKHPNAAASKQYSRGLAGGCRWPGVSSGRWPLVRGAKTEREDLFIFPVDTTGTPLSLPTPTWRLPDPMWGQPGALEGKERQAQL